MKIVKLKAGLGNQMFQYAYGRSLELSGKKIVFDTSFYHGNIAKGDMPRNFGLGNFNLDQGSEFSDRKHPFRDLIRKILAHLKLQDSGYWQNYKYPETTRKVLLQEFSLRIPLTQTHPELLSTINSSDSVSLAVRRGDYLQPKNLKSLGICSKNYYEKAIEYIESRIENPTFFIFSEDIDWIKANIPFKNHPVIYVSENKQEKNLADYQELILMSKCKHNIIANSSFSWWPAWLNQNPNKIVIAPDVWFTDGSIKIEDIVPPTWIKLPRD